MILGLYGNSIAVLILIPRLLEADYKYFLKS